MEEKTRGATSSEGIMGAEIIAMNMKYMVKDPIFRPSPLASHSHCHSLGFGRYFLGAAKGKQEVLAGVGVKVYGAPSTATWGL